MQNDYSISGSFGVVRTAPPFINTIPEVIDTVYACGWHRVTELYRIAGSEGISSYLLLFTVRGNGDVRIFGKTHLLEKDSFFIIPPNTPSEYGCLPGQHWEFYWMHLDGLNAARILENICESGYLKTLDLSTSVKWLTELISTECSASEGGLYSQQRAPVSLPFPL